MYPLYIPCIVCQYNELLQMESYWKKIPEKRCLEKTDNSLAPLGFDVKST
jgi:hypothetical protein